jgi:catechol 2,3-dioxygenase-like lactoylglutathione lyase family enzyme
MSKKKSHLPNIELAFLDHVAIRVTNLSTSVEWYERVLGMQKYQFEEWGPFPIFMMQGKFGVALFPMKTKAPIPLGKKDFIKIDHFAFNVDATNFAKAKARYKALGIDFEIQDHHFFHSIYTKDPDGHTVELTTLVVSEDFYFTS